MDEHRTPREPIVEPIELGIYRPTCHAETFDGTYRRQCTRPATFLRDGVEVCRQHARLARINQWPGD